MLIYREVTRNKKAPRFLWGFGRNYLTIMLVAGIIDNTNYPKYTDREKMGDNSSKLIRLQKKHMSKHWRKIELIDSFWESKDRTFAQYVKNYSLRKIEPFIDTLNGQLVVTVCDGRGLEALYLQEHGLKCTATDLVAIHLKKLKNKGVLNCVDEQNAEELSYDDSTFDWGLVKAGLHHLQRPVVGLYELLRVSKKGIIIIEAHDSCLLNYSKKILSKVLNFEESGNYVYRFRRREIEKICLSLCLPSFALHTYLLPWRNRYRLINNPCWNYSLHMLFFKLLNILLKSQGNIFCAILFKEEPTKIQINILKKTGFSITNLLKNPYL